MDAIAATLRTIFGTSAELPGLAPGLIVRDPAGWQPAGALDGPLLDELLGAAERHWTARRPAAAALAWKAYSYWVSLPAVVSLLSDRRVPLLTSDNVWVQVARPHRLVTVGLRSGLPVAVLPADPLAGDGDVVVVPDAVALVHALRRSLLDDHLVPLADAFGGRSRLPRRMLLGSVAASVAGVALRLAPKEQADDLLADLGLSRLVELRPDPNGRARVRRKTCCLAFTLPRPRLCTDCSIRR